VCMAPSSMLESLGTLMQTELERALGERVANVNAAELFLQQHAEETAAMRQLAASFERAQPPFLDRCSGERHEVAVLGVPSGWAGDQIRQLCVRQFGKDTVAPVASDDVSIYRENCFLKLG